MRATDYYGVFDAEGNVTQLFRVRWEENPAVGAGLYPRFEQIGKGRRWVRNNALIGTIGGQGGSDSDVWKISVEDAEKVSKRFGISLTAPTEGSI